MKMNINISFKHWNYRCKVMKFRREKINYFHTAPKWYWIWYHTVYGTLSFIQVHKTIVPFKLLSLENCSNWILSNNQLKVFDTKIAIMFQFALSIQSYYSIENSLNIELLLIKISLKKASQSIVYSIKSIFKWTFFFYLKNNST